MKNKVSLPIGADKEPTHTPTAGVTSWIQNVTRRDDLKAGICLKFPSIPRSRVFFKLNGESCVDGDINDVPARQRCENRHGHSIISSDEASDYERQKRRMPSEDVHLVYHAIRLSAEVDRGLSVECAGR
jgi:hypothetical protein